ncbi:ABC transporter permease subunit [candidate division CSSED10-310 bacterium]|uniref:ABC transporter permease subunit n=1 Tax=candidate division CSSED10-310 bacterium TaxID=2855610 RepID=A0ABV6YR36_UNCC1
MSDEQQLTNTNQDPVALEPKKKKEISLSILKKRWLKFKKLKRGYYSFLLLVFLYIISFFFPLLINNRALIVRYEGKFYFPAFKGYYPGKIFKADVPGEANYSILQRQWQEKNSDNWVLLPLYDHGPYEDINVEGNKIYEAPSSRHWFGTDDVGRDVFARLLYGFNISVSFGIGLTLISYLIGVSLGAAMGYFGGKFDLIFQRFIEIWSTLPLLFVVIIISSIIRPTFSILIVILAMIYWTSMTYFMRAEFYREKTKDYVAAAIAMGQSNSTIIFKHILPNSLVPIITYFPFNVIGGISSLVALDFLGFGLPPPTPSWGQMVSVGLKSISKWWMVLSPLGALFLTLLTIVFIGEAVREAFDPKVFSRLR